MSAQCHFLSGDRWHFQHGPIDIVIGADGQDDAVRNAHQAAWQRFATVLEELVAELPLLRSPVQGDCPLHGAIARRMWQACHPFRAGFITPMAAVAGSVAQELIACYDTPGIDRAWVNNGGDVALHLALGASLRVGLFADLARLQRSGVAPLRLDGNFRIDAASPVRGIATSGWRGRSFSLGIADSVTVLARTAGQADAAATIIANAVDLDDPRIARCRACDIKDDTDLGERLVTVDVPLLGDSAVQRALRSGARVACDLRDAGLIHSAVLTCQGWFATDSNQPIRLHDAAVPARPELLPA